MKKRSLFLAAAVALLWACSGMGHSNLVPSAGANSGAPLADPPYGTQFGIGGPLAPFEVPGM